MNPAMFVFAGFERGDGIDITAWIRMTPPEEATGRVAEVYRRVKTPHGAVDSVENR